MLPDCWLEHLELEYEADIWWFCSTHEYYKTTKYELQSPTLTAPSSIPSWPSVGMIKIHLPHFWIHSLSGAPEKLIKMFWNAPKTQETAGKW